MDTPVIRTAGALLALGLCFFVETKWTPTAGATSTGSDARASQMTEIRKLIQSGDYQHAFAPAQTLYNDHPQNQIFIEQLAGIDGHLGRYRDEANLWEQYLLYSPTPIEGCPRIGLAYSHENRNDLAIDALQRCLKIEPDNPDVLFYLANTYEREGQREKANEVYVTGLKSAPNDPDLLIGQGRIKLQSGDGAAALAAANGVLTRLPDNADALLLAGLANISLGDRHAARSTLEHAAQVSSRYADVHQALGQLAEKDGSRDEALREYRLALNLDPGNQYSAQRISALTGAK